MVDEHDQPKDEISLDDLFDSLVSDAEISDTVRQATAAQKAANLIAEMRATCGKTQAELAGDLGVSPSRISEAENPKGQQGPTYGFLERVALSCGFKWPAHSTDLRKISDQVTVDDSAPRSVAALGGKWAVCEAVLRGDAAKVPVYVPASYVGETGAVIFAESIKPLAVVDVIEHFCANPRSTSSNDKKSVA